MPRSTAGFLKLLRGLLVFEWIGPVVRLAREMAAAETSSAGRINLFGMLGVLVLGGLALIPAVLEVPAKVLKPQVELGTPVWQVLAVFAAALVYCTQLLLRVDRDRIANAGSRRPRRVRRGRGQ